MTARNDDAIKRAHLLGHEAGWDAHAAFVACDTVGDDIDAVLKWHGEVTKNLIHHVLANLDDPELPQQLRETAEIHSDPELVRGVYGVPSIDWGDAIALGDAITRARSWGKS